MNKPTLPTRSQTIALDYDLLEFKFASKADRSKLPYEQSQGLRQKTRKLAYLSTPEKTQNQLKYQVIPTKALDSRTYIKEMLLLALEMLHQDPEDRLTRKLARELTGILMDMWSYLGARATSWTYEKQVDLSGALQVKIISCTESLWIIRLSKGNQMVYLSLGDAFPYGVIRKSQPAKPNYKSLGQEPGQTKPWPLD